VYQRDLRFKGQDAIEINADSLATVMNNIDSSEEEEQEQDQPVSILNSKSNARPVFEIMKGVQLSLTRRQYRL
jgi:hypothetical protein